MIVEQKRQLCNKRRVDLNKDNERIDIRPLQARTKKEKREILGMLSTLINRLIVSRSRLSVNTKPDGIKSHLEKNKRQNECSDNRLSFPRINVIHCNEIVSAKFYRTIWISGISGRNGNLHDWKILEREREKKKKLIYSKKYIICYFSVKSYNFLISLDKMKLSAS